MAANPADTPLVEPTNPPKIIAVCGLSRPNLFAKNGVAIDTTTDLITPIAILIAITSELAPTAPPVTGPTIKVHAPAPIVAKLFLVKWVYNIVRQQLKIYQWLLNAELLISGSTASCIWIFRCYKPNKILL